MTDTAKKSEKAATPVEDMSLLSITDGENARGIPFVKFIDDVDSFANRQKVRRPAEVQSVWAENAIAHSRQGIGERPQAKWLKTQYGV